ncbi:MAG: hypothetical protein ACRCYY_14645 [Trueperaceae bacterium]
MSAGMARLHTLPVVAGSGLVLAMCCAVVMIFLSATTAQTLKTVNVVPVDECLEPQGKLPSYCETSESYTTLEDLQKALEKQGAELSSIGYNRTMKLKNGRTLVLPR